MKTQMMAAAAKRQNVIGGKGMTMINFIIHIFTKVNFIFFVFLSLFLRLKMKIELQGDYLPVILYQDLMTKPLI
jgi:hypothetical protein